MKGVLELLRRGAPGEEDSQLFASGYAEQGVDADALVPWDARANEVGARRLDAKQGLAQLQDLWSRDRFMSRLHPDAVARLERYVSFATIEAQRDVIRQDEYGNFMLVVLSGIMAVDRLQPWGEQLRLAEARPGDILGEMSLLDSGTRFSTCTTLTECGVAVLPAGAMDEMMGQEPQLAAALTALLARKLSMRLRVVGARLSDRN